MKKKELNELDYFMDVMIGISPREIIKFLRKHRKKNTKELLKYCDKILKKDIQKRG